MIDFDDVQATAFGCAAKLQNIHVENFWSYRSFPDENRAEYTLAFCKFLSEENGASYDVRRSVLLSATDFCCAHLKRWEIVRKTLKTPQNSKELQDLCNLISLPSILKNCDNRLQEVNSVAEKIAFKTQKSKNQVKPKNETRRTYFVSSQIKC